MYWSATETADAGPLLMLKPSSLGYSTHCPFCVSVDSFLRKLSNSSLPDLTLPPWDVRGANDDHPQSTEGKDGYGIPQTQPFSGRFHWPPMSPGSLWLLPAADSNLGSPLPSEPLASSPSITWEFPDSSLLAEGGVQTFPQSICVLACPLLPVQERQQLSPPWGSQADASPWAGRERLMLELRCHPFCPCHPPPILPPRWGSF